jgi:uncharacterized FlaG/YvyC family protein
MTIENANAAPTDTTAQPLTGEGDQGAAPAELVEETPEQAAERQVTEAAAEKEKDRKHKNRTTAFIDRQKQELAQAREELRQLREQVTKPAAAPAGPVEGEPTLESSGWDVEAYTRRHSAWTLANHEKQQEDARQRAESSRKQSESLNSYQNRIDEFTDDHPDFVEVVSKLPPLPLGIQAAIMAHELGPELAYHLAQNRKEMLDLARSPEHLAGDYVDELASRLKAARQEPASQTKPISSAPSPTPTVTGRAPVRTPPEKLTDDQWLQQQREQEKSRRRR